MTTLQLTNLLSEFSPQVADGILERAAIMEEANHWTAEEANRKAWAEYLNTRKPVRS
jgi:hypothetical protein